jgi:hypothetical protein
MTPRGLAAVYAGRLSAQQAVWCGLGEGSASAIARAGEVFGPGGSAWLGDFF